MHSKITTAAWILWWSVTAGQALVFSRWRRSIRILSVAMAGGVCASLLGMCFARFGSSKAYFHAFVVAGCFTDLLTLLVLAAFFEHLRSRARRNWKSPLIWPASAVFCLALALHFSDLPMRDLHGSPWMFAYTSTHIAWTWMAWLVSLAPVYCALTGANSSRSYLLISIGLALHIFVQAGVVDYLISRHFAHSTAAHLLLTYAYFLSLALWFASTATTDETSKERLSA